MSRYFMMDDYENVVVLKEYRKYKDTLKLFTHYKNKVFQMKHEELDGEKARLLVEMKNYPNHLLTKVKVQIFENATKSKL